jgi:hypothetical protein
VRHDGEADVSDVAGHRIADPLPALARPVQAIDAAVVLLPDPIRVGGGERDVMRVLAELG